MGALDYIWYTDTTLSAERVLQIPSEAIVMSHNGALPNPFMCSDHIPIVADIYGKIVPKPLAYRAGVIAAEEEKGVSSGGGRGKFNKR